jgi:hypothetical protein
MSFTSERHIAAIRKARPCDGCGHTLQVGQPAIRWSGTTDGDFGMAIYHLDCRAAEVVLNYDILGWRYRDGWCGLSDIDSDDWLWIVSAYPAVAARLSIPGARPFVGPYEAIFPVFSISEAA